jgi:hypothetical protein
MSEESEGRKGRKAREEYQLKAFRYIPDNQEGHNHNGYGSAVVDINRAYEIPCLWIEVQPTTGTLGVHIDPANPRVEQASPPAVRTT